MEGVVSVGDPGRATSEGRDYEVHHLLGLMAPNPFDRVVGHDPEAEPDA